MVSDVISSANRGRPVREKYRRSGLLPARTEEGHASRERPSLRSSCPLACEDEVRLWRTGISCYRPPLPPLPLLASGTPTAPTAAPPVPRRAPSVENARMRPDRRDRLAVRFHALEEINALVHRIPGTMVQALAGTTDALNGGRYLPLRRWDLRFCYPRRWQPLPPGRRRREQLSTPLGAGSAALPTALRRRASLSRRVVPEREAGR